MTPALTAQNIAQGPKAAQRLQLLDVFQRLLRGCSGDRMLRALEELLVELRLGHGELGAAFRMLRFAGISLAVLQTNRNAARAAREIGLLYIVIQVHLHALRQL